jgi:hypothetical protein
VDIDQVVAPFPRAHLLHDDRDGVRQLITDTFQDRLPDQFGD